MGKITNFLRWVFADKADTKIVTEIGDCTKCNNTENVSYDNTNVTETEPIIPEVIEEVKTQKKKVVHKKSTNQIIEELKEVDKIKTTKKISDKKEVKTDTKANSKTEKKPVTKKKAKKNIKK